MLNALHAMRLLDIIDILLVSFIIYRIMLVIRGTRAVQMLVGIALIIIIYFFSGKFELQTLHWLLKTFLGSILVVVVVLFQTDIRRALTQMGKTPFHSTSEVNESGIEEVVKAARYMSQHRIGALIVFERKNGLREYIDTGFRIEARIKAELIISIFLTSSPMHDGGMIISHGYIYSTGCLLPLSQNPAIDKHYGTRHRAAIGLSEETDALVLVVSEETGKISLVMQGQITPYADEGILTNTLKVNLMLQKKTLPFANWFNGRRHPKKRHA